MLDPWADWRNDGISSNKRTMANKETIMRLSNNGRVTWEQACILAATHNLYEDFLEDWWTKCCHDYSAGVSAADLAHWLGY
jgi:hypothetical protein